MGKKKLRAQICFVSVILILVIGGMVILQLAFERVADITDEVDVSRNIYKSSMQEAEQYLRKENIDYTKQEGKLEVGDIFFIMVENTLTIDSEKNDISRYVDKILNNDLSDIKQSFSDGKTTYYLEDIRIIEKDGDIEYYISGIVRNVCWIFGHIAIVLGGVGVLIIDPFGLFEKKTMTVS